MAQRGRPRKIQEYKSTKTHEYVLCESNQTYEQGVPITTHFDMDLYPNLNDFLLSLYRNGEITEEQNQNIMTVYYKQTTT